MFRIQIQHISPLAHIFSKSFVTRWTRTRWSSYQVHPLSIYIHYYTVGNQFSCTSSLNLSSFLLKNFIASMSFAKTHKMNHLSLTLFQICNTRFFKTFIAGLSIFFFIILLNIFSSFKIRFMFLFVKLVFLIYLFLMFCRVRFPVGFIRFTYVQILSINFLIHPHPSISVE